MSRPQKEIDRSQFETLCEFQCTEEEIAYFFKLSVDTLQRWCKRTYGKSFSEVFREKKEVGKISVRRSMYELAKSNPTIMIFWAKNFLNMTDKQEIKVRNPISQEAIQAVEDFMNSEE